MIPLDADRESRYTDWLRARHPTSWRHYLAWLRSLRRACADRQTAHDDEIRAWSESFIGESRRAARKGIRKFLEWAAGESIAIEPGSALQKRPPNKTLTAEAWQDLRRKQSGSLKERQIYTMTTLYLGSPLPASVVGRLTFDHVSAAATAISWREQTFELPSESCLTLQRWLRLRERIRDLDEERRRHRKTVGWAASPFLFPNARGEASGYGVIWRALRAA